MKKALKSLKFAVLVLLLYAIIRWIVTGFTVSVGYGVMCLFVSGGLIWLAVKLFGRGKKELDSRHGIDWEEI